MPTTQPPTHQTQPGKPYPLGATLLDGGVNFSLYSKNATSVQLLLFDPQDHGRLVDTLTLDPEHNKTHSYWHVLVSGIGDGQPYAYRVFGPYQPERGLRFIASKVLYDPYARALSTGDRYVRADGLGVHDNIDTAPRSVVVDTRGYDWEGDHPLRLPFSETIIYETHVRGMTIHPSSGVQCPGTFAGLVEMIPYLQSLGITALELLPVQQFDPQEVSRENPLTGEPLTNYWGYAPLALFAPHVAYSCSSDPRRTIDEFRDMVKAFHRAGIEVILDVVFNHTAESDESGPTQCYRGLENVAYYMLQPNQALYQNFTGCGNTVNSNHSVVRRLIMDCLRYWVREFHVDGFRFDLASVLSRNERGEPVSDSPILWEIESDPELASTKLIAEAWDAAGLYQLGAFTGDRWTEWNGRFRDDLRRFVRGDANTVRDLAWRLTGSFDVFRDKGSYVSYESINYVTCHDGFTLHDLVSYNQKDNLANGEGNRDGSNYNLSWNCGVEGPTTDESIVNQRRQQMKNLIALLLVARGTPLLLGGDELARTQHGNNNAYCQDNEISWFDWGNKQKHADMHRFVQGMIALRRRHATLTTPWTLGDDDYMHALSDKVVFHGVKQGQPDWGHNSHTLAVHFQPMRGDVGIYVMANAYSEALEFELPPKLAWKRLVDTSLPSPDDLLNEERAVTCDAPVYRVAARSVVILAETRD
jgi:isoamylase